MLTATVKNMIDYVKDKMKVTFEIEQKDGVMNKGESI